MADEDAFYRLLAFILLHMVFAFHNGRGSQEITIGELKSQCNMDYGIMLLLDGCVESIFSLMSAVVAHNIFGELHMLVYERSRGSTEKPTALWEFAQPNTLTKSLLQKAG